MEFASGNPYTRAKHVQLAPTSHSRTWCRQAFFHSANILQAWVRKRLRNLRQETHVAQSRHYAARHCMLVAPLGSRGAVAYPLNPLPLCEDPFRGLRFLSSVAAGPGGVQTQTRLAETLCSTYSYQPSTGPPGGACDTLFGPPLAARTVAGRPSGPP